MYISFSLCCALKYNDYILISVYCNTDFWSAWLHKGPSILSFGIVFFKLGLVGSGIGLIIFRKMSPKTKSLLNSGEETMERRLVLRCLSLFPPLFLPSPPP